MNRDCLIEPESVTDASRATTEMANRHELLKGAHFSVDGMLVQAKASRGSIRLEDCSDVGHLPENWRGEPHNSDAYDSKRRSWVTTVPFFHRLLRARGELRFVATRR
jgi:hypothetical protein